jgi:hypothetical protein
MKKNDLRKLSSPQVIPPIATRQVYYELALLSTRSFAIPKIAERLIGVFLRREQLFRHAIFEDVDDYPSFLSALRAMYSEFQTAKVFVAAKLGIQQAKRGFRQFEESPFCIGNITYMQVGIPFQGYSSLASFALNFLVTSAFIGSLPVPVNILPPGASGKTYMGLLFTSQDAEYHSDRFRRRRGRPNDVVKHGYRFPFWFCLTSGYSQLKWSIA